MVDLPELDWSFFDQLGFYIDQFRSISSVILEFVYRGPEYFPFMISLFFFLLGVLMLWKAFMS